MLYITRTQMDALQSADSARFEQEMFRHLRIRFGHLSAVADEQWLRQRIRLGIRDAVALEIRDETDVRRYLEYAVGHGRDWYRGPDRGDVEAVITDLSRGATGRMNHADVLMVRQQGEEADAKLSSRN